MKTAVTNKTLNDTARLAIKDYKQQLKEKNQPESVIVNYEMAGGQQFTQQIEVTTTTPNYGGVRYWFNCPQCRARSSVLYFNNGYSCRQCARLPYKTQNQRPLDRALKRVEIIRKALGWQPGIANGHEAKPRGMWASTFKTLVYEHDKLANQIINEIKQGL